MSDHDFNSNYGGDQWPGGYYQPNSPHQRPQQILTPSQEMKVKKLKQTKIGLGLLLGAVGCQIAGLLLAPVPCLPSLLAFGTLGLGISAYILLLVGAKAIDRPHRTLVITSMLIIGVAVVITVIVTVIAVLSSLGSLMSSSSDNGVSGEDIRSYMDNIRMLAFVGIVPAIAMAIAYAMILFKPSKKWGKNLLGVYVGLAVITSIAGAFIAYSLVGDVIDSIDPSRTYETDELSEVQEEQVIKSWIANLIRVPEYIVYMVVALGALLNVRKMEAEARPKLDSRLYDLKL